MDRDESSQGLRLDKWLWFARFYKTRSLASQAVNGGKVHLNGASVRSSHGVRPGDRISVSAQGSVGEFDIIGLPARRGPPAEAQSQYQETTASAERRARLREQHRLADQSRPRPASRPGKRDRRRLMRLQRDQR
jgi:ribosome-associated heat shock protein Hsp15